MDAERPRTDDIQPIKIRLRQVFSGNGQSSLTRSVYCPARERSTALESCDSCGHCQGHYEGPGDASAFCDYESSHELTLRHVNASRVTSPDPTPVADLMTTHVLCVRPDVSIDALSALLIERKISGVPVVDAQGAPIGIISKSDLVRHRYEDGDTASVDNTLARGFHDSTLAQATVGEWMTPVPMTFSEDAPISQVAAAMASERVHRVPLVGEDGTVVGIVSSLDIVGWYARQERHDRNLKRRSPPG